MHSRARRSCVTAQLRPSPCWRWRELWRAIALPNRNFSKLNKTLNLNRCFNRNALLGYLNPNSSEQGPQLVRIIDVECPKCLRRFRTVPSVVEHTGAVYCSVCGTSMKISEPKPITALSEDDGGRRAAAHPGGRRRS